MNHNKSYIPIHTPNFLSGQESLTSCACQYARWTRGQQSNFHVGNVSLPGQAWSYGPMAFPASWNNFTLPETNSSPLKIGLPKRNIVFQPSIFRCELLVLGSVSFCILVVVCEIALAGPKKGSFIRAFPTNQVRSPFVPSQVTIVRKINTSKQKPCNFASLVNPLLVNELWKANPKKMWTILG